MNKIMELAQAMAVASIGREPGPLVDARHALQAEVTRVEAELAEAKQETEAIRTLMNAYNLGGWTDSVGLAKELVAFRAKVAEMEGQEPVAEYSQPSGWDGLVKFLVHQGPIIKPGDKLYLAPGAKL